MLVDLVHIDLLLIDLVLVGLVSAGLVLVGLCEWIWCESVWRGGVRTEAHSPFARPASQGHRRALVLRGVGGVTIKGLVPRIDS
ncbi:hypothetical protein [Streptomyces sp. 11-1-2]|uniref:hypothetical protein n=1 Tax=unclassified Streptomyces TaxID=2593676 RepID=UPI0013C4A122|nr:hypothetical protein [Streptomyces sp. 11-1-2]